VAVCVKLRGCFTCVVPQKECGDDGGQDEKKGEQNKLERKVTSWMEPGSQIGCSLWMAS